jgi:carbon starvation protein CstA
MAAIALTTMTTFLVNHGRAAYAWFTAVPAVFVLVTTISAAVLSTLDVFWPMAHHPGTETQGWVEITLMTSFVAGSAIIIVSTAFRCIQTLRGAPPPSAETPVRHDGRTVPQPAAPYRCC